MLTAIMLFWIGQTLNAPAWYWWLWGIYSAITLLQFGVNAYKRGKKR